MNDIWRGSSRLMGNLEQVTEFLKGHFGVYEGDGLSGVSRDCSALIISLSYWFSQIFFGIGRSPLRMWEEPDFLEYFPT